MILNRFSLLLLLRLLLMLANMIILANIFGRGDLFFNQIILGFIFIIQFLETLHFVTRTNRDLAKFILAIQEADFTASFSESTKERAFANLYSSFKEILETIKTSKLEKEAQYQYLQTIIDHINIGIISIDEEGRIELMNKKSQHLLQVPYVKSWQLLKTENTRFFEEVSKLRNEENRLIEVPVDHGKKQLTVNVTEVTLLERSYRVITFKDIKSELERKEIEAWHKLIRILTHEIMNSITPMVSLTETMKTMLEDGSGKLRKQQEISDETIEDLSFSLKTIQSRSEGLLHFVEDYRKLTKIPQPEIEEIKLKDLISQVVRLMQAEIDQRKIELSLFIDEGQVIYGDIKLLEQVLINLLVNATHALEQHENPKIKVMSGQNADKVAVLEIADNGEGIDEDKLDKIFIPFFSTKESGSGIGLSLCQQIMNLHGGFLEVESEKGNGATFRLIFAH